MSGLSFNPFSQPSTEHYEKIAFYLESFLDLAEGFGQQSVHAQRILLSLYQPKNYQMSASDFCALDVPHIHHAVHLVHENGLCRKNIFELTPNAHQRMASVIKNNITRSN